MPALHASHVSHLVLGQEGKEAAGVLPQEAPDEFIAQVLGGGLVPYLGRVVKPVHQRQAAIKGGRGVLLGPLEEVLKLHLLGFLRGEQGQVGEGCDGLIALVDSVDHKHPFPPFWGWFIWGRGPKEAWPSGPPSSPWALAVP